MNKHRYVLSIQWMEVFILENAQHSKKVTQLKHGKDKNVKNLGRFFSQLQENFIIWKKH